MNKQLTRKNISIRNVIILVFILFMIAVFAIIGYVVFTNWVSSANKTILDIEDKMNNQIYNQIDEYLKIPLNVNALNQVYIRNGILDLNNEVQRERFFVSVLRAQDNDIYGFGYGTENGEYYGARRNTNGDIEILKENAQTGGDFWCYSVTDALTAGSLTLQAGKFDPRTSDWYKTAKELKHPVFSPVYKHFIMDDLTVSAAYPVYSQAGQLLGVLGTHIILSNVDTYLKAIVTKNSSLAVIIEKHSGYLVANSLDIKSFTTLADGSIKRHTIDETNNQALISAYHQYMDSDQKFYSIKDANDTLNFRITEYKNNGLDWLVITAVPQSLFMADIFSSVQLTLALMAFALIGSITIYLLLTNKLFGPIKGLINITERLSSGDLTQRAKIVRNDEIGRISNSFNHMADTLYMLFTSLDAQVKQRTLELQQSNSALEESKDQLQLILDSTAEAIFGVDEYENCTFCNTSCLKILGYKHQEDLLGKNMHYLIHHTRADGTEIPLDECNIYQALLAGKGTHADDEVFWRADGTWFNVEYYSYPQRKDGKVVGAVVTFMDNTERRKQQEHIRYISGHDSLTDLYNRMSFKDILVQMDVKENIPLTIIFGDINGLKLTNDIFGHAAGDALIKKSAEILKRACRSGDIIARVGGDEFIILLPNTKTEDAEQIVSRVKNELSKEKITAIKCSMSMGYDTKISVAGSLEQTMANAENKMYKEKTLNRRTTTAGIITTLIKELHKKSQQEKRHSRAVSELCQQIGKEMDLPETEIKKLKEAGFLLDIGKTILSADVLNKKEELTAEEKNQLQQHPMVGYRILNSFEDTLDIAEVVLTHREQWDGCGYPKGLKEEEIPLLARIISIAANYEWMVNGAPFCEAVSKEDALNSIRENAGKLYDPQIAGLFVEMMGKDSGQKNKI